MGSNNLTEVRHSWRGWYGSQFLTPQKKPLGSTLDGVGAPSKPKVFFAKFWPSKAIWVPSLEIRVDFHRQLLNPKKKGLP